MDFNKEIEAAIGHPKGETLEYQSILTTSKNIAQTLCSFANTKGGLLIFGVSESGEVIGLSGDFKADSITNKAISFLMPNPKIVSGHLDFKGKNLFAIKVEKGNDEVRLEGKKYIREGNKTKLSTPTGIQFSSNGYIYINKENMNKNPDEEIKYHAYDIDLRASYIELVKQLENASQSKTGITKDEYLSRIKGGIESYCSFHGLGKIDDLVPVILKYPAYNYHAHLAFQLMTFDINKIHAMLDFQHENYLGIDEFQKIVEHGVYDWIKNNSPFENVARLQKIMEWVDKRKGVSYKKNKTAVIIGDKILERFKATNSEVGQIIMMRVAQNIFDKLTPPEKKFFNDVFNGMLSDGFIGNDAGEPNFLRLGEKGYNRIYDEDIVLEENETKNLPTVVILTALKEEYLAVLSHLDAVFDFKKNSIIYEQGVFNYKGKPIANVIVRECGQKNPGTAQETERALTNFNPKCILFVGIAGSRKPNDFKVGDVIFPEKVHYYESGKAELKSFNARPDDVKPTFTLVEIAKLERRKEDWKQLIKMELKFKVSADVGVIAAGEQLIEDYNSEIGKIITKHYNDTACVAMEEYGFLNTVMRQGVEFATLIAGVVRGVSDILERDGVLTVAGTDRRPDGAKELASNTAAAFAYWLIIKVFEEK